ncbi:ABC transporter ATP-binding protein [Alicyclobacillus curvatus]|jgi:peptide/nickel transport system ATP-binding protein|nr:ABC transporter ATP-binding protein [Alicyclobacillus curvatus]
MANQVVLDLDNVSVAYASANGLVQAVQDVNLQVERNSIVGLVGESGCGKSTLSYAIMRLLKANAGLTGGTIRVNGQDVYGMSKKELKKFRWNEMSMVFQSAMSALNPVMTVEDQILDVFKSHRRDMSRVDALKRARQLLDLVRIDAKHLRSYPHELSGGMKQRIVIAIAIALEPSLVIMDEPTTALDVVVQRSILDQIKEIQSEKNFAILFISHDFSLVAELASRVAVMYAGRIVENTVASELTHIEGHHPYTQGLIRAIPKLTAEEITIDGIPGNPPDLISLPSGCAYHPRCPLATDVCKTTLPGRHVRRHAVIDCHLFAPERSTAHV